MIPEYNLRVLIRRNSDGKVAESNMPFKAVVYWWAAGNFSCDCNREREFNECMDLDDPDENPCGESRYDVQVYDRDTNELLWDEFTKRESY